MQCPCKGHQLQWDAAGPPASPPHVLLRSRPTYILSECVLVYMEPEDSGALLALLGRTFEASQLVVYEQVRPQATGTGDTGRAGRYHVCFKDV